MFKKKKKKSISTSAFLSCLSVPVSAAQLSSLHLLSSPGTTPSPTNGRPSPPCPRPCTRPRPPCAGARSTSLGGWTRPAEPRACCSPTSPRPTRGVSLSPQWSVRHAGVRASLCPAGILMQRGCGVGGDTPVTYWHECMDIISEKELPGFPLKAIVTH